MPSEKVKGPLCGIDNCRSRYYDETDGYRFCQNGHRQGDLLARGEDDGVFTPRAKSRQKRPAAEETVKPRIQFKGQEGFDLCLKGLQLVLRHQIWCLVHSMGLPAELEHIVRNLWILHIAHLEDRISDLDDGGSQVFSSTIAESEDGTDKAAPKTDGNKPPRAGAMLLGTLVLCYLGVITLRLPVTVGDLHGWIANGQLVYHRAIAVLPAPMRDRMPAQYHSVFSPVGFVTVERLHSAILHTSMRFHRDHGIAFPPLNHPLLLFRFLKELALPLEVYPGVTKLAKLLGFRFGFCTESKRTSILDLPEARLMALLVCCVKVLYPFDDVRRAPRTATEPASVAMDWAVWCHAMNEPAQLPDEPRAMSAGEMMRLTNDDILQLRDVNLDQYLAWFEETWLDQQTAQHHLNDNFLTGLLEMFPKENESTPSHHMLSAGTPSSRAGENRLNLSRIQATHKCMVARQVVTTAQEEEDDSVLRPGSRYKSYQQTEEMPATAKKFYGAAASIAGLSKEMLVGAVCLTERRITAWCLEQRKQARAKAQVSS